MDTCEVCGREKGWPRVRRWGTDPICWVDAFGHDQDRIDCLKIAYEREKAATASLRADLEQANTALSLVSGALADTGSIPVGPALKFGEGIRALTRERDEARDLAIRRGEIQVRLQGEINKARSRMGALEDVLWTHWNCTACDDNCRACEIAIRAALAPTKPAAAPKEGEGT